MADPTALTPEQVEAYFRDGYIVLPSLFGSDDLARVQAAMDDLVERALASGDYAQVLELETATRDSDRPAVRRVFDPFLQHEAFRALATDRRLVAALTDLIGPDLDIQASKLNMKPPRVGSVVDWHQDLAYYPHTNDSLVTCLIYLDDATEENGCLMVLPRHHHHFFDHTLPDGTFAGAITEVIDDGRFGRPVPLPGKAGSVILMHCITPHSSLPNRSAHPRRTLIFQYRATDAVPLYTGPYSVKLESTARRIAGRRATRARFAGPPQPIPLMREDESGRLKSLYQLQEETRAQAAGVRM